MASFSLFLALAACVPERDGGPIPKDERPARGDETAADGDGDADTDTDTDTDTGPAGPLCPDAGMTALQINLTGVPDLEPDDAVGIGGFSVFPGLAPDWELVLPGAPTPEALIGTDIPPGTYVLVACLDRVPRSALCADPDDMLVVGGGLATPEATPFPADEVVTINWDFGAAALDTPVSAPKDPSCP